MLVDLSIRNFALIEELKAVFTSGLITITGETGAGKSLLIGALGLLLGKRSGSSGIHNTAEKCVIEGTFFVEAYGLEDYFKTLNLDYEHHTVIRREILSSGKSRAFVNDTPVTLQALSKLGVRLIDIHGQHQTRELTSAAYQFEVIDAYAKVERELNSYKRGLKFLTEKQKERDQLLENQIQLQKEHAYNNHLLQELIDAKLTDPTWQNVEEEYIRLHNIEAIRSHLSTALDRLNTEQIGVIEQLRVVQMNLSNLTSFSKALQELFQRTQSITIDLDDIQTALQDELEKLDVDPNTIDLLEKRIHLLHDLQSKHQLQSISDLIAIQEKLQHKVNQTESISGSIQQLDEELQKIKTKLDDVALRIHQKRSKALPKLTAELERILKNLGMPHAAFNTELRLEAAYLPNGKDSLQFLFSANKGTAFGELKKVASGGELSRIMMGIKAILSRFKKLPTLIFDEIDTGVSGEVAQKMADLMSTMSQNLQLFSITHLPQIAASGTAHYKVFKKNSGKQTVTELKLLSSSERIREIAEMIGGKQLSDSALQHAQSLLDS